ncbi:MAG: DUF6364 family protein [Georgfuchsia sp.]
MLIIDARHRELYYFEMKITIDIDDSLIANAKVLAVQQHTSLTRLMEEGLQLRLQSLQATAKANKRKHSRKIPVFNGRGGMVAGINPASNKAMLNVVEGCLTLAR